MLTNHPGAVLFMFLDVFLLTGALILTGAQAVQVNFQHGFLRSLYRTAYFQQTFLGYHTGVSFLSVCCMI
jgi:hypothetical protein